MPNSLAAATAALFILTGLGGCSGPGEVVHFEKALAVPAGGLVYLAQGVPAVRIGYFYAPNAANPLNILVGGEHASSLALRVVAYVPGAIVGSSQQKFSGSFANSSAPTGAAEQAQDFPLPIDATEVWVFAELTATGTGRIDLDLTLLDPWGKMAWASTGPDPHEIVRVYDVNLRETGKGTYKFHVANFQRVQAAFSLTVTSTVVVPQGP